MGKAKLIIGLIVLLIGLAFAAMPETVGSYLNLNASQLMMQGLGVVLIIIGLVIMVKGRK